MSRQKPGAGKSLLESGLPILNEWNFKKNHPLTPSDVFPKAKDKVWWRCAAGHQWEESLNNRSKGRGCPYCSGRRCVPGENDLRTLHPELFSQIANEQELLTSSDEIHPGSTQELTWKCESGHEWRAQIRTRVRGHSCPFCSKRKVAVGQNDLATLRPDLVSEWCRENPEMSSIGLSSQRIVSWKCTNNPKHKYELQVKARVAAKTNPCPICNFRIFIAGQNDLKTLHPLLAEEWSEDNVLPPYSVPANSKELVKWVCTQGHFFEMRIIDRVKRRKGCPNCVAQEQLERRTTQLFAAAKTEAVKRGGDVKPTEVDSLMTKLSFICKEGHEFTKTIRAVVVRGGWCDICRLGLPENQAEAAEQLAGNGFQLTSEFESVSKSVTVKCLGCGDVRRGPFRTFRDAPCGHYARAEDAAEERLRAAVLKLEGSILSDSITSLDGFIKFRCSNGHTFRLTGRSVVVRGSWCRECGNVWVTPGKIKKLIESRGGELRQPIPTDVTGKTKIQIRCSLGHEFENDWNHMAGKRQSWCQICSKGSKSEEIARTTFRQLFGGEFAKRRPKWLVNSRGRQMELDGYELELGLAFEYQGRQHFENVGVYKMGNKLQQRKEDDKKKRELCAENGVLLVELRWDHAYEDFPKLIRTQLGARAGEFNVDWETPIQLEQAFIRDDRLNELRSALSGRNLTLLSEKWIDVSYRYKIRCDKCGHTFAQSARSYLNSRGVAGCKRCAMKVTALQMSERRLGLPKLQAIAEQYSAKLISTSYIDVKTPYEWMCNAGHIVQRTVPSIERSQSLCTQCSSKSVSLETLIDFARSHGGELVSRDFSKQTSRYEWACECGHTFTRSWVAMKNAKYFCPNCSEKKVKHAELAAFAAKHSGKLLSQEVTTIKDDSTWECKMGHVFDRPFAHMKYRGKFICPEC